MVSVCMHASGFLLLKTNAVGVSVDCHSHMCLAGEIFGGLHVAQGCNDGVVLLGALGQPGADIAAVLSQLRGPWAVVFWHAAMQTLWCGRDAIGEMPSLLHAYGPAASACRLPIRLHLCRQAEPAGASLHRSLPKPLPGLGCSQRDWQQGKQECKQRASLKIGLRGWVRASADCSWALPAGCECMAGEPPTLQLLQS